MRVEDVLGETLQTALQQRLAVLKRQSDAAKSAVQREKQRLVPIKTRVDALKRSRDAASNAYKRERDRQTIHKAQQQIYNVYHKKS